MTWRVLVADDEPAARRGVRQLLTAHPDYEIVAECRNGEETLAALDRARPNVVFLDVQMPGLGGFDVIRRRTPERMPVTVFLTAFDQFAVSAFEAEALDYLVKPVTAARFAATLARVARQLAAIRAGAHQSRSDARFVVTTARGATVVHARDIDWIEAADNYARIWTGARSHLIRESLTDLERRVRPLGFVRAHRQALIRLDGVRELKRVGEGELVAVLVSGAEVPIARRRRAAISSALRGAA